jgi:predicted DNA binding CopG/RHH family protein
MAIAAKPKRQQTDSAAPDPMDFIHGAESQQKALEAQADPQPAKRPRKEPVIIRFDETTLTRIDQAASKRGLSRAALVRMLVIENLPD